jgi:epoxyqueuosine reductase
MIITEPIPDHQSLAADVRRRALELGFDLVGIADASASNFKDYWRRWIDERKHGAMGYMARRLEERTDPAVYLPGAHSIICVAMNYHVPLEQVPSDQQSHQAKIARYALGDDYHEFMKSRLHVLADWLRSRAPDAATRCCVDTAPVAERELSARAGIGWVGKNTLVINPSIGSWILLGEIITTLDLSTDEPITDHCGTCTRCIDACPTGAITEPYQLDPTRCISYWTIEQGTAVTAQQASAMGDWLYGCDICQDVCPWNHRAPDATLPELRPRFPTGSVDMRAIKNASDDELRVRLRHSAMKRVKLPILRENSRMLQENRQSTAGEVR